VQNQIIPDYLSRLLTPAPVREDPPRNEKRVKVRVKVRPRTVGVLGMELKEGNNEVLVYESDLPKMMERVEDAPEMIEQSQRLYERSTSRWIAEQLRHMSPEQQTTARVEIERRWRTQGDDGKWSPEAYFQSAMGRGIKPLLSVEVIERDIPAPRAEQEILVEAIAERQSSQMTRAMEAFADRLGEKIAEVQRGMNNKR
jgi:hypothetical protein